MLEFCEIFQKNDFESAFSNGVRGFDDEWWQGSHSRVGEVRDEMFVAKGPHGEVARVRVNPRRVLCEAYEGFATPKDAVEIVFIEVRSDQRRRGIGELAVRHIKERYPGRDLVAFSEEADEFWRRIGWTQHPRQDGDTYYRPLFACFQR